MRKAALLSLTFTMLLALPALAVEKHQSYLSYDDGGTVVRQAEDGREIEARVNLPIFPGDEVVTSRRGRAEIRLSDGNVLGIDRATAVRLESILDSYEGEDSQTVVELRYGKIGVHRTEIGREFVRLDTRHASYIAQREAVYFVEADARGADRVIVFEGSIEVRTPTRRTRLRAGEGASLDDRGVYDLVSDVEYGGDDFERWFARRAERNGAQSSRYLDRRMSHYGDELDANGRWVMVAGIGWSWRPFVSVGWRPYYNGYWHRSRHGYLTWVSYEPWGWAPYHYGRWAFDSMYGWVWVPGGGYAPAWVYWWYEPGFFGWAPAGWWDCHRPYYDWAYDPYRSRGVTFGAGFYGRVRVGEMDLRPWTFLDSNTIVSTRVDRAALTIDAVKARLGRSTGGFATVSSDPARFTNEQFRDPAGAIKAIARRGVGDPSTAPGAAAPVTDVTSFFRRDANPGTAVRDRIVRSRG
ncbi:MAG: FecR family protein, partial [Thermoanaerobaculia bacterium]